jgi:hypothetical protein
MASDQAQHCPFLNRADARCSDAFSLEKLDHAFKYCFGRYTYCSVYMELLIERRMRRSAAAEHVGVAEHAEHEHASFSSSSGGPERVVQVSVRRQKGADRNPQYPAHRQGLPALPGF